MRHCRMYALFEKRDGRWVRASYYEFPKELATQVYGALIARSLLDGPARQVRPVKPQ